MRDIALYKSIHYSKSDRLILQQYVINGKETDLYLLDLSDFDVFEYRKFSDGDLLTLQLSGKTLDKLCDAWLLHKQKISEQSDKAEAGKEE